MGSSERAEEQTLHLPPRLLGRSSARCHFVCPFFGGAIYADHLNALFQPTCLADSLQLDVT
jgi:hypothetical protein